MVSDHHVDRSGWDAGPWDDEVDRYEWVDETTGLPCLIVRNRHGALCGYVGVGPEHPLFGADTDDADFDVHGGINYANECWHFEDGTPGICHTTPNDPRWWFGFDCHHMHDIGPGFDARMRLAKRMDDGDLSLDLFGERTYKTVDYVRAECASLAGQLAPTDRPTDLRREEPTDG